MAGSEPVLLVLLSTMGSLAAQALARLRWRCIPDEGGKCRCMSGCSDVPLEHRDEHQLDLQEFELGGRRALLVTARTDD